jgi:hypothetical protein
MPYFENHGSVDSGRRGATGGNTGIGNIGAKIPQLSVKVSGDDGAWKR